MTAADSPPSWTIFPRHLRPESTRGPEAFLRRSRLAARRARRRRGNHASKPRDSQGRESSRARRCSLTSVGLARDAFNRKARPVCRLRGGEHSRAHGPPPESVHRFGDAVAGFNLLTGWRERRRYLMTTHGRIESRIHGRSGMTLRTNSEAMMRSRREIATERSRTRGEGAMSGLRSGYCFLNIGSDGARVDRHAGAGAYQRVANVTTEANTRGESGCNSM